jgi:carbamoyl-phosphate synthase small subunit
MSFDSILVLPDGSIFYGEGFGEEKVDIGEIVFNTSMTGYQEIITDPSYKSQIITFTILIINSCISDVGMSESNNLTFI